MADQKEEEEDAYDGPWIEKRIEWKCPDRKRHNVVLFGSWNRFKGGDELEYQGKQIFACNVKLPLGTYVYRFLIDAEDWETHNNAPKTARNGIEYNQIHINEHSDDEEEDEFGDANNEEDTETNDANTTLMMGADEKRRGRPSVELDLGTDFGQDNEEEEGDELDAPDENDGNEADADVSSNGGNGTKGGDGTHKKHHKKKKSKRRRKKKGKKGDKEQDKEWAKYVFVQQLRLQQQHNDEINRVKTLWKQERQVRVEMHKKVVKQLKEHKVKLQAQTVEIERLTKTAQIGQSSDAKLSDQFKAQIGKLQSENASLQQELDKKDKEFTEYRKNRIDDDKQNRQIKGDWESKERKYVQEINGFKSQIKTLEQTQLTLESNLNTLKDGNDKTMELKSLQFAEREKQWKVEKDEYESQKKEYKKLKTKLSKLETNLQEAKETESGLNKKIANEQKQTVAANEKIEKLENELNDLKNSNEANEKIKSEVEKVKKEQMAQNKVLNDKCVNLEKQMAEQKAFYEDKMAENAQNNKAEIAALQSNSDKKMNEIIDKLKGDISTKNEELSANQTELSKLQSVINEEKANNDAMNEKLTSMKDEIAAMNEERTKKETEIEQLTLSKNAIDDELASLKDSSSQIKEEQSEKIVNLDNECKALKVRIEEETKSNEERVSNLEKKCEDFKNLINEKNKASAELTQQLTESQQEIEKYKNSEIAKNSEIESLTQQLGKEREALNKKETEFEESLNKFESDMNAQISQKEEALSKVRSELNEKSLELTEKLEEFSNASKKISELEVNLDAERTNLANEKKNNEAAVAVYIKKEERIHNSCKSLFSKFQAIREEMKSVQEEQISQLEEVSQFFGDFSPLLAKVFEFNQNMIEDLLTKYKRELSLRRKYFNMVQDLRGNIRVFCRFRPLLPFELKKNFTECVKFPHEGALEIVDDKGKNLKFEFDQIYTPKTTQVQVSEDATEYIQSVMDGYNVSIFAYGQTGSGKTYTMNGPKENPGVNLRALKHLFKISEERSPQFQYKIKVSIFEIYNEVINDLIPGAEDVLNVGKKKKKKKEQQQKKKKAEKFKVRHLPDGSVDVPGLTSVPVTSDEDIHKLEAIAQKNRSASATDMNAHSSRSHMLLVVDVSGINIPANIKYFGKLYLVDLAGSERVKKSGAKGQALKEAQNINKSLSALGDVMQALQQKQKFIPYRNSTLTDLMANALGGNAKTIMFINCCPASAHAFETVSSLKFAKRVGKIELGQAKKNTKKSKKDK